MSNDEVGMPAAKPPIPGNTAGNGLTAWSRSSRLAKAGDCLNLSNMSIFKVNVVARNPKCEELATRPLEALVDTGSELTWLPADVLKGAGITPRRKRIFATGTQQKIEREVGYAILSAEGYETNDEVVFAESGDMTLLGVRTRAGFGVMVDNIGHRFVATTTIVAVAGQ